MKNTFKNINNFTYWLKVFGDNPVPESLKQDGHLHGPCGGYVVEAHRTPTVRLKKHHQKSESDEDHHMHVLKHAVQVEALRLVQSWVSNQWKRPRPELSTPPVKYHHHNLARKQN